jgi:tetratricopeptide (TPR) repeat protein/glycosyltransferase involved in cell wall biosynthesis
MQKNIDWQAVKILLNQAGEQEKQGDLLGAIPHYQEIINLGIEQADIFYNLGHLYYRENQLEQAIKFYEKAILKDDQFINAYFNLGNIYKKNHDLEQAVNYYEKVINIDPEFSAVYQNLGNTYKLLNQWQLAINAYEKALQFNPASIALCVELANLYDKLGDSVLTIKYWQKAVDLEKPHTPELLNNYGVALQAYGDLAGAIAQFEQALAIDEQFSQAHANLGMAALLVGNFTAGWREFEWRCVEEKAKFEKSIPQPWWQGENIPNQTLLIHAEQGIGDNLQFIRYIPIVRQKVGKLILRTYSSLTKILQNFPGIDQIILLEDAFPHFDYHIPLLSLPYLCQTDLSNIPADIPYIKASGSDIKLDTQPNILLKIGIVWAAKHDHPTSIHRSCCLDDLAILTTIPYIQLYSLQKGPQTDDLANHRLKSKIINLDNLINDLTDTANIIQQLDLIISVDTSVAHLAGAMGKPIWLLLTFSPDWRWLLDRSDSPWYPTMQIFRQEQPGNWQGVLQKVHNKLNDIISHKLLIHQNNSHHNLLNLSQQSMTNTATSKPLQHIGIGWSLNPMMGWGVYGINLTLQLSQTAGFAPVLLTPSGNNLGLLNPLLQRKLIPFVQAQQQIQTVVDANPGKVIALDIPVLHSLGNNFGGMNNYLQGKPDIGVIFFEDTNITTEKLANAQKFVTIITGSHWNEKILRERGLTQVRTVLQGIDPTVFHPAPKANIFSDRFVIFSGGKLEYRKGQDIIIAAFKKFQQRHPEALLINAWHNFWPQFMAGLDQTGNVMGLPAVGENRHLKVTEWLVNNGIPAQAVIDIGATPNQLMGQIVREADVAVFTNRCEGGTNLVAMECLACGLPTILSANTGHLDLISDDNCYPLFRQNPVKPTAFFPGVQDWGESDVDEVVENLERVYSDRPTAKKRGEKAALFMEDLTWQKQIQRFIQTIQDLF